MFTQNPAQCVLLGIIKLFGEWNKKKVGEKNTLLRVMTYLPIDFMILGP